MAIDLWLKAPNGHVIGFSLPLHPTIDRQLRDGLLARVDEDGSPWQDPSQSAPYELSGTLDGGGGEVGAGTPDSGGDSNAEGGAVPAEEPVRPAQNAPKADWVAYAVALGLMDEATAKGMTKTDLVTATTPPEMTPTPEV